MKKTFEYLRKYINDRGFLYKIKYEHVLNKLEKNYNALDLSNDKAYDCQLDTEYVVFEDTGDEITLTWNISKLQDFIKIHPQKKEKVSIETIKTWLEIEEFNTCISNMEVELNNKDFKYSCDPLYIMKLNPMETHYIIDGKHRLYRAYKNKEEVEIYYFNSDALIQFFVDINNRKRYQWLCEFADLLHSLGN